MADVDECLLLSLPSELLALLVLAVPAAGDVGRLAATCRALHRVASLPGVRAVWLVRRYGAAAWRTGLARHRRMLAGWTRVPTADDALPELENDVLGDFAPAPFALPGPEGPVPTVPLALCALGLPPPRHLLQEFFAWFTNNRNGFRAWDRETGDAFTDAEPDTWGNVVADNWDNETVVFGEEAALLGPPSPPLVPSESSSSSSSDLGPASTSSPALALPPPPTLSFLPLPPRQSVPPAPKVHDQVLLTQLLEAASAAYGPSELALLGRDELLLERLLRLDAVLPLVPDEEDPEGNLLSMEQLEGEEGARRWIARRKEHFDRVKEQVLSVIFTYRYAPHPPPFRPPRPRDPRSNQPSNHAITLMSSLIVHSPSLLSHLIRSADLDRSKIVPQLLARLFREMPVPALRAVFSNPNVEQHGFGLTKPNVTGLWDSEEALSLKLVVDGMLLPGPDGDRMPGPDALRLWGAEHLRQLWSSLEYAILTGSHLSKSLLREHLKTNPGLLSVIRRNIVEIQRREREGLELRARAFVRVLVGVWTEQEWPDVLFSVFRPDFGQPEPDWAVDTVLSAFHLPKLENLTPSRAKLAIDAVCALMRVHRQHHHAGDGAEFPEETAERLLRFADAAYAYLLQAGENGISTVEDAERDAQTGQGTFMITPGAGVFACLARGAVERILAKGGGEEVWDDEIIRLQGLLDAAAEVTIPEGSGTILDYWELDDAARIMDHAEVPDNHPHAELIRIVSRMARAASKEICRRDRASHQQFGGREERPPPSPRLNELFSPLRERFFEEEEEPVTVWSRAIGGDFGEDAQQTAELVLEEGVEIRRITFYGSMHVQGLGFYLSDRTYSRLGRRHVLRPPTATFILEAGENIIKVTGFTTSSEFGRNQIGRIQFHTDRGRSSPVWGTQGDREFVLEAPKIRKRSVSREPAEAEAMDIDAGVPRAPTATSLEIPSQPQRRPLIGFSAAPNSPHSDMQSFRVAWRKVPGVDRERDRTPTPTPAAALDQQVAAAIENLALAFATPEDDLIDD